ncbi:MAG: hypothetical protein C0596_03720 [Marinilabiliales bacterium]|nr:MAG: hypothetical protein C0596_03720 [Marinilabiliales bacterium]
MAKFASAGEMVLKGIYQGKDLYIINPMLDIGEEYCAYEVTINEKPFDDVINSSAFRITLAYVGLEFGQEYEVIIKHHDDCTPKLVNPEVLKPLSTYELVDYEIGYNNMLKFTTHNESGQLTFYIEEYRWDRWIEVGQIPGEGGPDDREYSQKVYPFNGENQFRIYQVDNLNRKFYSDTLTFEIDKEPVKVTTPSLRKVKKEITFSSETYFAVINEFGEELITGSGTVVDVSPLKKGEYFLNFENEYVVFKKK